MFLTERDCVRRDRIRFDQDRVRIQFDQDRVRIQFDQDRVRWLACWAFAAMKRWGNCV